MNRDDFYRLHQENLEALESQMEQVKTLVQKNLGKKMFLDERPNVQEGKIRKIQNEILYGTRLYTFLLCSWLEARLNKILYENSAVAFNDAEIERIRKLRKMSKKWQVCFDISICKYYGITNSPSTIDYSSFITDDSKKNQYIYIKSLLDEVEMAITIRNRLAHGQWIVQLNSNSTNYASSDVTVFFQRYDNIQKLDILFSILKNIAEIISTFVVYKDKDTNYQKFNAGIDDKVRKIKNFKKQLETKSFEKYCKPFYNKELFLESKMKGD